MTTLSSVSQCRTLTHLYLFKAKDKSSLVLKIYDLFQKCISKTTFTFSQLGLSNIPFSLAHPSTLVEILFQKTLLPLESAPSAATAEECLKDVEQIISQVKPKVLFESKELEMFSCSITLDVFKDPVVDNHGHTFEKSAIEKHLTITKTCPLSREPINTLTPNLQIKHFIEEAQKKDPIPTFALFKKQNTQLASNNLKLAQDYIEAEEYDAALNAYAKAFQYTKDWTDYQALPLLFKEMGHKDKARLAYLYLIQYQLQDKKVSDALQTVEQCRKSYPELIQISPLLIKLYRCTKQTSKAIPFAFEVGEALAKEHPQEAIAVYKQIIAQDPLQFKAYLFLAPLLKDPLEKAHILLKGACHAIQEKEFTLAGNFCQEAEKIYEDSFVDRLVELDLLSSQNMSTKERLLQIAALYEKKKLPSLMIKAYRMLASLDYIPFYYDKIITGYDQIGKSEKSLQWSLSWLTLLIEKQEWPQAEMVSLQALTKTQQKIPLYEQQETIYTHWKSHQLSELWTKLGKAYLQNKQLLEAEKTYQKAFKQFNSFEHAIALADTLILQDKKASGVQTYYQACSIALLEDHLDNLSLCVKSIKQIDPKMEHLKLSQRMMLLTQSRMLELSKELSSANDRIRYLEDKSYGDLRIEPVPVVSKPILLQAPLPLIAFGAAEWAAPHSIKNLPAYPPKLQEFLAGPCPIWKGKTAAETHIVVPLFKHITTIVNDSPVLVPRTLKTLDELDKSSGGVGCQQIWSKILETEQNRPPAGEFHYAVLTKDVLPGSRNKSYSHQKTLVESKGYTVPPLLDATTAILWENRRTGARLFGDSPLTYTRCQEKIDVLQLVVGGFAPGGLYVHYNSYGTDYIGVAGFRKF